MTAHGMSGHLATLKLVLLITTLFLQVNVIFMIIRPHVQKRVHPAEHAKIVLALPPKVKNHAQQTSI
jgi:hypothetical protein